MKKMRFKWGMLALASIGMCLTTALTNLRVMTL